MAMDYQKAKDRHALTQDRLKRAGYAGGGDTGQDTVRLGRKSDMRPSGTTSYMNTGPSPSRTDLRDDTHLFQDVGREYAAKGRIQGPPDDQDDNYEQKPLGRHYRKGGRTK